MNKLTLEALSELETEIIESAHALGYDDPAQYLLALHELHRTGQVHVPSKQQTGLQKEEPDPPLVFENEVGQLYHGDSARLMSEILEEQSIDLIVTSPPFGLVKEKAYGNEDADKYLDWFEQFAVGFRRVLKDSGSLVIDIGGAWRKGIPVRSLYHFELLIRLCRRHGFHLAQEFYWWNPAKLPLPAEWVNVRRIRVRDSVNCVWWLSKTPFPKASNRRVLQPYSASMLDLFERGEYNTGERSGGHKPGETSFLKNHGGSIPHNLIAAANTDSNSNYHKYCHEKGLPVHPARFPLALPAFFIQMLTDDGDKVLDPFAGSAAVGEVAESMNRQWICCEKEAIYIEGAIGRFSDSIAPEWPGENRRVREYYRAYPPYIAQSTDRLPPDGGRTRPKRQQRP